MNTNTEFRNNPGQEGIAIHSHRALLGRLAADGCKSRHGRYDRKRERSYSGLRESCVIYARSHRTIIDSWFLHCFEDTKANYSTMPSDLKIGFSGVTRISGCLIWSLACILFFVVFVWDYWDREKSEKEKVRCDFAQLLFPCLLLCLLSYI